MNKKHGGETVFGLFRGKRKDDGIWVYGYYMKKNFKSFICYKPEDMSFLLNAEYRYDEIIPDTLTQNSYIVDDKFNDIYNGDILRCIHKDGSFEDYLILLKGGTYLLKNCNNYKELALETLRNTILYDKVIVVGNRFDNENVLDKDILSEKEDNLQRNVYRGEERATGKIIFGYYIEKDGINYICDVQNEELHEVLKNTVSQFSFIYDKNERRIFGGDILNIQTGNQFNKYKIMQSPGCYILINQSTGFKMPLFCMLGSGFYNKWTKINGNII